MKKVFAKLVEVTPDLAAEILEKNTMNRNISQIMVKRYAMAMQSGEWEQNGRTITIAEGQQPQVSAGYLHPWRSVRR